MDTLRYEQSPKSDSYTSLRNDIVLTIKQTLASFIDEAGLSQNAGVTAGGEVTIEQILQEKKTFDVSLNFEKLGVSDKDRGWRNPGEIS